MEHNKAQSEVINKVRPPSKYKVVMLNDESTSFDFVILVLMTIFEKNPEDANGIAMKIHTSGRGLAGVYCLDIAEMKVLETHSHSKANGFPLKCILEKE